MGPVEGELMSHVREVRTRLRDFKPHYTDKTKELMLEVALLKNKLAAAEKEIGRLSPKTDSDIIDKVLSIVSKGESVSKIDLLSKRRIQSFCIARHICFYLLTKRTIVSAAQVGRTFNKCDHTSVLYGRDKVTAMRLASETFNLKIKEYESLM